MSTRTHLDQAEAIGFEAIGVDLDNAAAGAYAFHWQMRNANGNPFGDTRWLVIGVERQLPTEMPVKLPGKQQVQFGMNVNIWRYGCLSDSQ
jgi:hypothetical protein